MKTALLACMLAATLAVPLVIADSGQYFAPGGITGFCDPVNAGSDVGIVCELACGGTCTVTVTDDAIDDLAVFQVCDWDAATQSDGPCSSFEQGSLVWTSSTGVIDIFITVGTTGTVTTT